jgi:hypothetical protein
MMASSIPAKPSIGARVTAELIEFVIVALYLYICFAALAYLKSAILQAHGILFAPFGFAAVKALICAKFVLVGRAMHLGERFKALPLIWPTLHRSLAFLLLLLLNALEEIVVGLLHHRDVADSLAELGGGTLDQLMATSVVMLLVLIPFFAFRSLGEVVGERNLVRVFFRPRRSGEAD